jgi:hypothetical protein
MKVTIQVQFGTGAMTQSGIEQVMQALHDQVRPLGWVLKTEVVAVLVARQTYEVEVRL